MNIPKAIEILLHYQGKIPVLRNNDYRKALGLGIEALKAVKECRASHMFCPGLTMPGETED